MQIRLNYYKNRSFDFHYRTLLRRSYFRKMLTQIYLTALIFVCSATPRTPKIYNVLISSKENLSPSHALPVYQPVLRTTSLGYILPSIVYQTPVVSQFQITPYGYNQYPAGKKEVEVSNTPVKMTDGDNIDANNLIKKAENKDVTEKKEPEKQVQQTGVDPLSFGRFVPYHNPFLADYDQLFTPKQPNIPITENFEQGDSTDPKQVIANLKRNPEIPDIPPGPIPVKIKHETPSM